MLMSYETSLELLKAHLKPYEKVEKVALTQCLGTHFSSRYQSP